MNHPAEAARDLCAVLERDNKRLRAEVAEAKTAIVIALDKDEACKVLKFRIEELGAELSDRKAEVEALKGALEKAQEDTLLRTIAWLRESQRMTAALGKHRTATTVKDLADALEKTLSPAALARKER